MKNKIKKYAKYLLVAIVWGAIIYSWTAYAMDITDQKRELEQKLLEDTRAEEIDKRIEEATEMRANYKNTAEQTKLEWEEYVRVWTEKIEESKHIDEMAIRFEHIIRCERANKQLSENDIEYNCSIQWVDFPLN